jgi:hypothetical protein
MVPAHFGAPFMNTQAMTTITNDDYAVRCCSGATRMQSELSRAFNLIAPRPNWKAAIDVTIYRDTNCAIDEALISDACFHFTGSVPTFSYAKAFLVRIRAAGYYATIGA